MFMGKWPAVLRLSLCITVCAGSESASSQQRSLFIDRQLSDRYDAPIHAAATQYLPTIDWTLYWGQLWQESGLNSDAVSPVGAKGLAQFMPASWNDVIRQMGVPGANPNDAKYAIQAGAFYLSKLMSQWTAKRPEPDRHKLSLASYNAGIGNIAKAQRACGNPSGYDAIMFCLPFITGAYSKETLDYAPKIYRWGAEKAAGTFK
jgi:soluble lytic murein transglycosylase-like protein